MAQDTRLADLITLKGTGFTVGMVQWWGERKKDKLAQNSPGKIMFTYLVKDFTNVFVFCTILTLKNVG